FRRVLFRSTYDYSAPPRQARRHEPTLWTASMGQVPTFEHASVIGTTEGQLAYLDALRDYGVAVVRNTPSEPGEVERFAETIGHVRETAFERIHNVQHDPTGYNEHARWSRRTVRLLRAQIGRAHV